MTLVRELPEDAAEQLELEVLVRPFHVYELAQDHCAGIALDPRHDPAGERLLVLVRGLELCQQPVHVRLIGDLARDHGDGRVRGGGLALATHDIKTHVPPAHDPRLLHGLAVGLGHLVGPRVGGGLAHAADHEHGAHLGQGADALLHHAGRQAASAVLERLALEELVLAVQRGHLEALAARDHVERLGELVRGLLRAEDRQLGARAIVLVLPRLLHGLAVALGIGRQERERAPAAGLAVVGELAQRRGQFHAVAEHVLGHGHAAAVDQALPGLVIRVELLDAERLVARGLAESFVEIPLYLSESSSHVCPCGFEVQFCAITTRVHL